MSRLKRPTPARRLVLTVTPLADIARRRLEAGPRGTVDFADLSLLGRAGIWQAVRQLRSNRFTEVLVTGEEPELFVFRDALSALARLACAQVSRLNSAAAKPVNTPLPLSLARIGLSTFRALCSLGINIWNSRPVEPGSPNLVNPRTKRCLYLRPTLMFGQPVGGSVGHVAGVVNALRKHGHQIKVLAMFPQPLLNSEVQQVIVPPLFRTAFPNDLNRHRYHRSFFHQALRSASEYQPNYIYARYTLNDLTAVLLRRRLRIPLVLEYNGSEVWVQRHWGQPLSFQSVAERIEIANLMAADVVVVVSEEVKKQVLSAGVSQERVLLYPNCVNPELFDPSKYDLSSRQELRRKLDIPSDADLFTFVGTFGQWHGTDVLATAIHDLIDNSRSWLERQKIHFLFVGDGPLAPKVREILGADAGRPFVTLAGYRPQAEAAQVLAASDVLLSPHVPNADGTPFFGSPTKLFEYMAMAKPIVASDLDQIGQVLRGWQPEGAGSHVTGGPTAAILAKPGDPGSLLQGIHHAADMTPQQRQALGDRARFYALRSFTWDRNVDAVLNRLDRVLNRAFVGNQRRQSLKIRT